jgi:hypothetical protein
MANETASLYQPEQSHKNYQAERAHKDFQASIETGRAASQAAIFINGGAATAILTFLSKQTPPPLDVVRGASEALVIYAFGVLCGTFSIWFAAHSSAYFASKWEKNFFANDRPIILTGFDRPRDEKGEGWLSGHLWLRCHRWRTWIGFLSFIGASCWIARAFLKYGIKESVLQLCD